MLALHPERVRRELAEAGATAPIDELMPRLVSGGVRPVSAERGPRRPGRRGRGRGPAAARSRRRRARPRGRRVVARDRAAAAAEREARVSRVAVVTGAARGIGAATVVARWPRTAGRSSRSTAAPTTRACRTRWAPRRSSRRWSQQAAERATPSSRTPRDEAAMAGAVRLAEERFGGLDAMIAVAGVDRRRRAALGDAAGAAATRCSRSTSARRHRRRARRHPGAAAPSRAARRALPRGRLGRGDARPADARRVLRGEGGRRRPRPRRWRRSSAGPA